MNREPPKTGEVWLHFKGTLYQIMGAAEHSETHEELVLYRSTRSNEHTRLWARPVAMFLDRHSSGVWRFERVTDGA